MKTPSTGHVILSNYHSYEKEEQDDQDHEVVIPVNILKLLQDEDENAAVATNIDKRDDIVDFLASENHVVGTDFPYTPQTTQVNILKM